MPTVYLVSGGGRGLGLGFVKALAARPDTMVFAGARDPSTKELADLVTSHPDKVFPVKLESADEASNKAAAKFIEDKAGKLDVVIANAAIGIAGQLGSIGMTDMMESYRINVLGPLVLFQQTQDLLRKSSTTGKFVAISSLQGSVSNMVPGPAGSYAAAKSALNSVTVKLQEENQDLIVFPVCPGFVATDGSSNFLADMGAPPEAMKSARSIAEAIKLVLTKINEAVKVDKPKTYWSAMDADTDPQEITF